MGGLCALSRGPCNFLRLEKELFVGWNVNWSQNCTVLEAQTWSCNPDSMEALSNTSVENGKAEQVFYWCFSSPCLFYPGRSVTFQHCIVHRRLISSRNAKRLEPLNLNGVPVNMSDISVGGLLLVTSHEVHFVANVFLHGFSLDSWYSKLLCSCLPIDLEPS